MSNEECQSNLYPYQDKDNFGKSVKETEDQKKKKEEDEHKLIPFNCSICKLTETCHYYGRRPPFARGQIEYVEDSFVMMDPFSPREKGASFLLKFDLVKTNILCLMYRSTKFFNDWRTMPKV